MNKAPVVMFVYNRLDKAQHCLEALEYNEECKQTELYIFADGGKNLEDEIKVSSVRNYLKEKYIPGSKFLKVHLIESEYNKGLATSIINGVTEIINQYGRVIVVEDDLLVSKDFLEFMNGALDYYESIQRVGSISAYSYPLKELKRYKKDVFLLRKGDCWGWGTWKDRWQKVDWEVASFDEYKANDEMRKAFDSIGCGLDSMLCKYMEGTLDVWAVRWCYHLFRSNLLTVYPKVSRARNDGLDGSGSHCTETNLFHNVEIGSDSKCHFEMLEVNRRLEKSGYRYESGKQSLLDRAVGRLRRFRDI